MRGELKISDSGEHMVKFSEFIVKKRRWILVVFLIASVLSAVAIPFVYNRVNSDLTSYLPEDTQTTEGQIFLSEVFNIYGDCMVSVEGVERNLALKIVKDLQQIEGVTSVMWKETTALISLLTLMFPDYADEINANVDVVNELFYDDGGTPDDSSDDVYVILMTHAYGVSSNEAFNVLNKTEEVIKKYGDINYEIGGMTNMTKEVFESTIFEVWKYTLVAIIVVIILLIIFTDSWLDPVILLVTLGVSVLINMGTNIIYPTTSIITFSASAVLQIGLSMDYAIFLLHAVKQQRHTGKSFEDSLVAAIPLTLKTVLASALTTAGGFIALFFMRFTIGEDLGMVLAKGIVMSLITVIFFQPALILLLKKPLEKLTHKSVNLRFRAPVKRIVKYRTAVVIALLVFLLPIMILQSGLDYGYLNFIKEDDSAPTLMEEKLDTAANQLVIAVPFDWTDTSIQYEFIDELKQIKKSDGKDAISFVLGVTALLPQAVIEDPMIQSMKDNEMMKNYVAVDPKTGITYSLYTVGVTTDVEGEDTFATLGKIEDLLGQKFDKYYMTGMSQGARDFAAITPDDFTRVSIASIAIIFIILLFTFRSLKYSVLLVLIIQFGIWINLALQRLIGQQINFMSYIIISSVQMGATVDYAILVTSKYLLNRRKLMPSHAAYQATTSSVMSVITSASILAGACFSVYFVTSNLIVAEITMLVANGAIISLLLVIFALPAVLSYMDRPIPEIDTWRVQQRNKLRRIFREKDRHLFDKLFTDRDFVKGTEEDDALPADHILDSHVDDDSHGAPEAAEERQNPEEESREADEISPAEEVSVTPPETHAEEEEKEENPDDEDVTSDKV